MVLAEMFGAESYLHASLSRGGRCAWGRGAENPPPSPRSPERRVQPVWPPSHPGLHA